MASAIHLVKGREKSLRRKHPWVFSRGISRVDGTPELGETVDVFAHNGEWLAKAAYSPNSQIRARVWSFTKHDGQTTAHYVAERLEGLGVEVTRLAHGVPVGGELDHLDDGTLATALRSRRGI